MADVYVEASGREVKISSPDKLMFPEQGWTVSACRRGREFNRTADGLIHAACGIVDILDHLPRSQVRISQDLCRVLTSAAGHADGAEPFHDVVLRMLHGPFRDHFG